MSGLIWGALGQAVGNASSNIGNYMMRSELDEERQRERMELQRERERAAAELQKDRLAAQSARTGGSDGGLSAKDIGEGGADEGLVARRAGMTVPELRAMRRYSETGDTEPFKRNVERYKPEVEGADTTDAVLRKYAKQMGLTDITQELPPGFEAEARAKMESLAKIEESYRLGGKYDDVTKGRRNQQEVDMSEAAIRRPEAAGVIGQGMAAGKGNDLIGGDSNVTRNKFTGATSTTDVGKSVISENQAQAGQATAAGRLSDAKANAVREGEDPEVVNAKTADLQRKINSARARLARELGVAENEVNAALLSLSKNKSADGQARLDKAKPFIDRLDEAQAAMDNWKPGKTKTPPPAAAPPAPGGRKVGDTQVVQAGPNQGKTARWDGRGWVLVD